MAVKTQLKVSLTVAGLMLASASIANAQNSDFERKRAEMRAQFQQIRAQHEAMMSPQGRQFLRNMDAQRQARQTASQNELQNRISAARRVSVSPSQCALKFNDAVSSATKFSDLDAYFSARMREMHRRSPDAARQLAGFKRAYIYDCKVRNNTGVDHIGSDGRASVWLEGFESDREHGIWVNLVMVPEDNYWRIEEYKSQCHLQVIKIMAPKKL